MEYSAVLKPFSYHSRKFDTLNVTSSCVDQAEWKKLSAQQCEKSILIYRRFIGHVVCKLTFRCFHVPHFVNFTNDCLDSLWIPCPSIFYTHSHYCTPNDVLIHWSNGAEIDLFDIINKLVAVMNILHWLLIDESDQLRNLFVNIFLSVGNIVPKNEVLGDDFKQHVIWVALFNGGEGVRNCNLVRHLLVVWSEV